MVYQVTTNQLKKLVKAIGNGDIVPNITDDPYVNFLVNCVVGCDNHPYDPKLYQDEVEAFREIGAVS